MIKRIITRPLFYFFAIALIACKDVPSNRTAKIIAEVDKALPDSVVDYINSALDTVQRHSIHANRVDWDRLKDSVFHVAENARHYRDTYEALALGLKMLDDNHSFFKKPEEALTWKEEPKNENNKPGIKSQFRFSGMMLDSIAKITLGSYSSGNLKDNLEYSKQLQSLIRSLDKQNPKGWIVDLRYNSGGNMWPMLAGISPLLFEGELGQFITEKDKVISWFYKNGAVGTDEEIMLKIPNPYKIKDQKLPLVVLVSNNTASSGEALLISLKARPNTLIIGEPTAGLSTANQTFELKDGAQLILTTAIFADRNGKRYGVPIRPDIDVSTRWYYFKMFEYQIVVREASRWILSK